MTEFLIHVAASGERWDNLAWRYYGQAHRFEPILRANPGLRDPRTGQWPIVPPEGVRLLIPVLPAPGASQTAGSLPPWLR